MADGAPAAASVGSVQDRDGGRVILNRLTDRRRVVRHMFADGGFAGRLVEWAATILRMTVEIVRKPEGQRGFSVLPRRRAVKRTLAWITAHRPRLRTPPAPLRSYDPLGRHQHHDPPHRPRSPRHPTRPTTPRIRQLKISTHSEVVGRSLNSPEVKLTLGLGWRSLKGGP